MSRAIEDVHLPERGLFESEPRICPHGLAYLASFPCTISFPFIAIIELPLTIRFVIIIRYSSVHRMTSGTSSTRLSSLHISDQETSLFVIMPPSMPVRKP